MNQINLNAVQDHKVLHFYYKNHKQVVKPYVYGREKKTGHEALYGRQTGGTSQTGKLPGWRLFHFSDISRLEVTDIVFIAPSVVRGLSSSKMSQIYASA